MMRIKRLTKSFYAQLLLLLVLFCLLETLRATHVFGFTRAESPFAEGAREMFLDQQYIAPLFRGVPYFDKPPLHYWLIIGFYQMFGISILTARAVSIIAALITIVITAVFTKRILGKETAILSAIILSTTYGFYELASTAMPDMLLCLFENIAIFSAYVVLFTQPSRRRIWLIIMAIAFASGWMTKGPIALLIPVSAIVLTLLVLRQWPNLSTKELLLLVIIFLAGLAPWHITVYQNYGTSAFDWLYLRGNVKRFLGLHDGYNFGHPITYIVGTLIDNFLPWTVLLLPALCKFVLDLIKQNNFLHTHKLLLLLILWAFSNTTFFTFSSSNWGYYSLPIYPALSIATAYFVSSLAEKFSQKKIQWLYIAIAVGFFITMLFHSLVLLPIKASKDKYLNFSSQLKEVPSNVPILFHADINEQYLLVDHVAFENNRIPLYCNKKSLQEMTFVFKPFIVLLPKYAFDELPSACKAKLKVREIESMNWINFPGCGLAKMVHPGEPVQIILATHRYPMKTVPSDQILSFYGSRNIQRDLSNGISKDNVVDGLASWWLAKAYFSEAKPPDVVVLGSSELGSLLGADAYVYNRTVDITGDHRSRVLEHDLDILLNKQWHVLVSPLPEAMLTDYLAVSRALFSSPDDRPKLVVITFTPGNFIDDSCKSPTTTEAYSFFSRYQDNSKLLKDHLAQARIETSGAVKNDCPENISPLALGEPFERIRPGEITITSGESNSFRDNSEEFRTRYKNPYGSQLNTQLKALEQLLLYLKQQKIKAVAFNMPMTKKNIDLLPGEFWSSYNDRVHEICGRYDVDWFDLNTEHKVYSDKDFIDGTHLNLAGGLKLTRPIAFRAADKFHWVDFEALKKRERTMF